MEWYNAKKNPPKANGRYMAVIVYDYSICVMDLYYDTERKGWNVGLGTNPDSREHEQFPDYWGELPTKEQLKGGRS